MALFDEQETRRLLTSSLATLQARHARAGTYQYPQDFLSKRIAEIFELVPADLLRRPVHVPLVAEIAANPAFDLRGFNLYRLYEHFIKSMVERDTVQKPARKPIPLESRLDFQRELAWWAWARPATTQGCFFRHEVPASLLESQPNGNAVDLEGKRNEYIVSTLTEEKEAGVLFFAHRSFQEFLVAERLRLATPTPAAHRDMSTFLTVDVINFLRQAPDQSFLTSWYETLRAAHGPLGIPYLQFYASVPQVLQYMVKTTLVQPPHEIDAWTAAIVHLACQASAGGLVGADGRPLDHAALMSAIATRGGSAAAAVATLSLLTAYSKERAAFPLTRLVAVVMERCLRMSRQEPSRQGQPATDPSRQVLTVTADEADFATKWVTSMRKRHAAPGEARALQLLVDLDLLERSCTGPLQAKGGELTNPFTPADATPQTLGTAYVDAAQVLRAMDPEVAKAHQKYVLGRGESFLIVPVERRRRTPAR